MAQKVIVSWVDDLDGGEAEGTVSFGLDGRFYEIDLSGENAARLRDAVAPFVGAARRSGTPSARATAAPVPRATQDRERNQAIRDWAASQGMEIAERGRISKEIVEAYEASRHTPAVAPAEQAAAEESEQAEPTSTKKKGVSAPVFSGG